MALADRLVVLRSGEVQQIGSPEDVYAHPTNAYVAGFMGYRNMLRVTVESVDGENAVVTGEGVRLAGVNRESLPSGAAAVAAVRPEDFSLVVPNAASTENTVSAVVEIVEYHGREQAVEARLPSGDQLHVRTNSRLAPGDTVQLRVPVERVLIFAEESLAGLSTEPAASS